MLVTSQESKFLGGSRRQDLCRLQIWTTKVDAPLATQTPLSSVTAIPSRRRSSVFTLSTVSSGLRKSANSANSTSSSSSLTTDIQTQASFGVPVRGAAVYAHPVMPCIVLFAHKVPERGENEEISRSFLIIDSELLPGDWFSRSVIPLHLMLTSPSQAGSQCRRRIDRERISPYPILSMCRRDQRVTFACQKITRNKQS